MHPSRTSTLHERFSWLAACHPDHPALSCAGATVTYGQLDSRSHRWAAALAARGVRPGDVVPVHLPRSVELVTALLAVLKTGAAYTLLDPDWPTGRVDQARDAVGARTTVTAESLPELDRGAAGPAAPADTDADTPACVFFTSGTTGTPKAVLSPHGATLRLFDGDPFMRTGPGLVIPAAAALPWDAFALELWSALATGGTAVLITERYLSATELRTVVAHASVNTAWLTSSLFNQIVDEDLDAFTGLTELLIGGERLSVGHVRRFLARHGGIRLVNGYGPVETTVFATTHDIVPADTDRADGIPLGRPVPRTSVRVVAGDAPTPVGTPGEIVVGGRGVAIGYLDDPAATEAKFVLLPEDGGSGRYYRTGDRGYLDHDGVLHYAGRLDRQVKVRGVRVEPAEVEAAVAAVLPVTACRVVAAPGPVTGDTRLVAFCVAEGRRPDGDAAKRLRQVLLPQQVPTVSWVDRLPLTANGKVDESQLLAGLAGTATGGGPVPAGGDVVDQVRGAFRSVLGGPIDDDTSFFAAGGSSLDAGRLCTRLSRALGRPVPMSRVFEAPTVTGLAMLLDRAAADPAPPPTGLTPMQRIFLLRALLDPDDLTNHCLMTWRLRGPVDRPALSRALAYLHRRQPMLHSAYGIDAGVRTGPAVPAPPLHELTCADEEEAWAETLLALAEPFDPAGGHVWRPVLARWGQRDALLGLAFHHVAFDGSSEAVVACELSLAYRGTDLPTDAVAPPSSAPASDRLLAVTRDLAGVPPLRWPDDRTEPDGVRQVVRLLPPDVVDAAAGRAARAETTLFVTLLSAWGRTLAEVCRTRDFAVGVPLSLRDGSDGDVGCRMTTVPVRLTGAALADDGSGLPALAQRWRHAVAHREAPLTEVLRCADHGDRPPVFQTMFALQDTPSPRLTLPGVEARFVRPPYLDLPLDLHLELWPEPSGALTSIVSYRTDAVGPATAQRCLDDFARRLRSAAPQEADDVRV
ncbi:amino acid adenylation domain-containing protein [Micromonospora sp. NPDC049645]|uniref:amino acid adenylation domain-containing protein n=1 Tax=Micromonospora sp. NPDC049645 TaxID=3155508 RepID=UPI003411FEB6